MKCVSCQTSSQCAVCGENPLVKPCACMRALMSKASSKTTNDPTTNERRIPEFPQGEFVQVFWQNAKKLDETVCVAQGGPFQSEGEYLEFIHNALHMKEVKRPHNAVPLIADSRSPHFLRDVAFPPSQPTVIKLDASDLSETEERWQRTQFSNFCQAYKYSTDRDDEGDYAKPSTEKAWVAFKSGWYAKEIQDSLGQISLDRMATIVKNGKTLTIEFGSHRDAIIGCDSITQVIHQLTRHVQKFRKTCGECDGDGYSRRVSLGDEPCAECGGEGFILLAGDGNGPCTCE